MNSRILVTGLLSMLILTSGFDESDEIEDEENHSSTEVESVLNKTAISQKWEDSEKQKTSNRSRLLLFKEMKL